MSGIQLTFTDDIESPIFKTVHNDPLITHYIDPTKKISIIQAEVTTGKLINKLMIREGGFNNVIVVNGQKFSSSASGVTEIQEIGDNEIIIGLYGSKD